MIIPKRQAVLVEAESWLGTPFRNNAMVKGAGVGCGTLMIACYSEAGVLELPSIETFGHFPLGWSIHSKEERYLDIMKQYMKEVETPEPGDAAVFKLSGAYGHAAIVVSWPRVIHVSWKRAVEYADASQLPLSRYPPKFFSPFQECDPVFPSGLPASAPPYGFDSPR